MANEMKKPTYAGRIKNTAAQEVKAIFPASQGKKGTVSKGNDLRTKGGNK